MNGKVRTLINPPISTEEAEKLITSPTRVHTKPGLPLVDQPEHDVHPALRPEQEVSA